jgi:hypothetical protein
MSKKSTYRIKLKVRLDYDYTMKMEGPVEEITAFLREEVHKHFAARFKNSAIEYLQIEELRHA